MCALPSPSTATLVKEGHEGPVHVGKRSQSTGWLLTEVPATSNVPPVPAPEVASPTLLKHSFWSETPWSLTTEQFPLPLLPVERVSIGQVRPSWALGTYWVICCGSLASIRDQDISQWAACVSALHEHGSSCPTQMPPWARCTCASHIPALFLIMAAPAPVQSSHTK